MADRIFRILLVTCAVVLAVGVISALMGHDWGLPVAVGAMGIAGIPLFHFASQWPLEKDKRTKGRTTSGDRPGPRD